jgi:succinate dehydrogenase/fumarate reductase cytochrome b subunit
VMINVFDNGFLYAFYWVGILSTCFHFANGILTFCITWGLTISPTSQKVVGVAAAGVGVILAAMAVNSMLGFTPEGLENAPEAVEKAPEVVSYLIESVRHTFA